MPQTTYAILWADLDLAMDFRPWLTDSGEVMEFHSWEDAKAVFDRLSADPDYHKLAFHLVRTFPI